MVDAFKIAEEAEKKLHKIFKDRLVKVILYGSYACGMPDSESDIDIMALVNEDDATIKKMDDYITDIVAELSYNNDVFVSIIVKNYHMFYERSSFVPFYQNVLSQGIEINV